MKVFIQTGADRLWARQVGLVVGVLLSTTSGALAQSSYNTLPPRGSAARVPDPRVAPAPNAVGAAGLAEVDPSDADRDRFDDHGTRGREGLGADPRDPEGPGDVQD